MLRHTNSLPLGSSFEPTHLKPIVETLVGELKKEHPQAHGICVVVMTNYGLHDLKSSIETKYGNIDVSFSPVLPGHDDAGQVCLSFGEGPFE